MLEDESALCAGVDQVLGTAIKSVLVTGGLDRPVDVQAPRLDPNRVFVVEQGGRIRIVENGVLLAEAYLDISALVTCCFEQGLLGLAFHPQYEINGRFFVNYVNLDGDTVIARYERSVADVRKADPTSAKILLTVAQPSVNHNAGQLAFDGDGYLYVSLGDGGGSASRVNAQDDNAILGKMLRLDADVEDPPYYAAPDSNPDTSNGDARDLIWSKGLRNPWRFSFDRLTDELYLTDVGQEQREEVSVESADSEGALNYGWPVFEGATYCNDPFPLLDCPDPPTGYTMPVLEYDHTGNCSITGGYVYRGCAIPDLSGTYFYSDYCAGGVRTFELIGGQAANQLDRSAELAPGDGLLIRKVSTFGQDARGALYIATVLDGNLFKIVPDN